MIKQKIASSDDKEALYFILSLDVVVGALAVGLFAVTLLNVHPNPVWWIILPLAVWTVYTSDHLIDGFSQNKKGSIYRHWFHFRHRNILIPAIIITSVIAGILTLIYLEMAILKWGLVLSAMISVYFLIIFSFKKKGYLYFQKELFIAFAYTAGIFLAPLVWYGQIPCFSKIIPIFILFILAWVETVMISYFDYNLDVSDENISFSVQYGKQKTRKVLILILIVTALLIMAFLFPLHKIKDFIPLLIELVMTIILFIVVYTPEYFQRNHRYRWIGEIVFWMPGLLVLIR